MNTLTIGLVGNPNTGKTTVFNALTGANQRVGNWPGVTVERKSGQFKYDGVSITVDDLPGIYSLAIVSEQASIDERIACEYILNYQADVIVNIVDATNLERHLYLTLQLLEMGIPVILALNMMDMVEQRHIYLSVTKLAAALGCPVIALTAQRHKGIKTLKQAIADVAQRPLPPTKIPHATLYPPLIQQILSEMVAEFSEPTSVPAPWIAVRLLEDDIFVRQFAPAHVLTKLTSYQDQIRATLNEDPDILLADARYRFIQQMVAEVVLKSQEVKSSVTALLDRIVLNRFLGIPIFLCVMYAMFLFAINIGGAFQDFFDITSNTIFVDGTVQVLQTLHTPAWLIALLANGIGKGINTTVTFIPVIGAMFLFLAFLEDSGYMARAAFVIDRLMRALGLPGKSFVPMIIGFGCNVPAVMAARTLENKRDRILTVMMSPFMSCGARLAIYAVFTAAFFPVGGQNIVFALYLLGIGMAMLTGLLLRRTLLQGQPAPLLMELPPYHLPNVTALVLQAWQRLKGFVFRAGKLIIPICILLGFLSTLTVSGTLSLEDISENSLLATVGRWVTPIFSPMGINSDNWPATVGLLTGVLAKEVVIGTLNTLYSQIGHLSLVPQDSVSLLGNLHDALLSIPANLSQLIGAIGNPIMAQAPVHSLSPSIYGIMYRHFDGQAGAFAYLLFVLLYFPCISTTAAMLRELDYRWALFSALWTTGVAYISAVIFYQTATLARHPWSSVAWISGLIAVFLLVIVALRLSSSYEKRERHYEFA